MRDDDAFTRSSTALEAEKPAGLNRRQLLRAGAWAAPALVLATAAPAAAASTPPGPTVPTYRAAVAVAITPKVGSWETGTIVMNYGAIKYDYSEWSLPGKLESSGPSVATFTYNLDVINPAGAVVRQVATNALVTVAKYQQTALTPTITGLPRGTYRVRLTITSATFTGQTMNAAFVATLPAVSTSSPVKVD